MAFSLLKTWRKSGKQKIKQKLFIIPFFFSFLNAFFGLLSVIHTISHNFTFAAYCILLAACMDFWDGRLARAFGSCSDIGMELDSLCDATSFCFAPAILMYTWRLADYGPFGLLVVGVYLCAGLYRLAKFNALHMNAQRHFVGLPTTLAASFLATVVIASVWIAQSPLSLLVSHEGLFGMVLVLSVLKLSAWKFLSPKQLNLHGAKSYLLVAFFGLGCLLLAYAGYPVLFLIALAYVLGNIVFNVITGFLNMVNVQ
ncbi:MAG: CDP-alcohol phosphatidyltransferase family protein [Candidatus Dependentiae bacterium]|nr:CDP-alcohol phosphatidyltransferase family protein [Candidatus Dependentiae bacterium]